MIDHNPNHAESDKIAEEYYSIADTVHRLAWAFDHNDQSMFHSVFTEDATLDNRPLGAKIGLDFPIYTSRDEAANAIMPLVGPLDTSHTASNFRITFTDENQVSLHCHMMAQHFRPGQGPKQDTDYYLMMNLWSADLIMVASEWRIHQLVVDCDWTMGNRSVITGQ